MTSGMTRRILLVGAGAAVVVADLLPRSAHAQNAITLDQFKALSARLTDVAVADLDPDAAQELLDSFISNGDGHGLSQLATDARVTTGTVADDIVAAWYSGVYNTPTGPKVATFDEALVWTALDYTKPFASCGGATGYWSEPPQS